MAHLQNIVDNYRRMGFCTAIDDFGAGFAGLSMFCDLKTDLIKIDMALLRDIDKILGVKASSELC